jgi:hypothetical protein
LDAKKKRLAMKSLKTIREDIEHKQKVKFVREHITPTARYMMIAEEAAEVSQAAAKIARIFEGSNPTPKSQEEAWTDLIEEMNDIFLAYEIATGEQFTPERNFFKVDRCVERVCEANDICFQPLAD